MFENHKPVERPSRYKDPKKGLIKFINVTGIESEK